MGLVFSSIPSSLRPRLWWGKKNFFIWFVVKSDTSSSSCRLSKWCSWSTLCTGKCIDFNMCSFTCLFIKFEFANTEFFRERMVFNTMFKYINFWFGHTHKKTQQDRSASTSQKQNNTLVYITVINNLRSSWLFPKSKYTVIINIIYGHHTSYFYDRFIH